MSPPLPPAPAPAPRLDSVDLLRGIVMAVMALDHVRDFFHSATLQGVDPMDLARTTPWIFVTRFVTHYCAPLFSFLAGTGVFLSTLRGKSKREVSWFLVTRGLWLVLLELTFFYWGWFFALPLHDNNALVIWALGWSMVVLAGLIHLPLPAIAAFAGVLIVGHNALDGVTPADFGAQAWVWHLLHVPGTFPVADGYRLFVMYPLVPWVGVMAAGYCLGAVYRWEAPRRRLLLFRLGAALIGAFVVLRLTNLYGNPVPWTEQPRPGFTLLSFLDVAKYPPSLDYLLITLGPGLLALAALERGTPTVLQPLLVFGRVPFFYYLLHLPLIHGAAWLIFKVQYGRADFFFGLAPAPAGAGFSLPVVYLVWAAVVAALYLPCRWFADYKRRHRDAAWLSYF